MYLTEEPLFKLVLPNSDLCSQILKKMCIDLCLRSDATSLTMFYLAKKVGDKMGA